MSELLPVIIPITAILIYVFYQEHVIKESKKEKENLKKKNKNLQRRIENIVKRKL